MKTYFAQDPIFEQSKLVTAIYQDDLNGSLATELKDKIILIGLKKIFRIGDT